MGGESKGRKKHHERMLTRERIITNKMYLWITSSHPSSNLPTILTDGEIHTKRRNMAG